MGRIGGIVLANKRMFSVDVTETDAFLEMPLTAQALYFHLGMRGDDDGFVSNPRSIVRVSGCSESDLTILAQSGYIITFRSGVIVISDWKVNNYLRGDRYKTTVFQNELSMLEETANKRYVLAHGTKRSTVGIPNDNQVATQYRVEKSRVAVVDTAATAADSRISPALAEVAQYFRRVVGEYPPSANYKLTKWLEVFPPEVLCAAFDEAAESGHRSWKYVNGILKSWQADGVRTLGDVETRRDARKKPEQALKCERKLAT